MQFYGHVFTVDSWIQICLPSNLPICLPFHFRNRELCIAFKHPFLSGLATFTMGTETSLVPSYDSGSYTNDVYKWVFRTSPNRYFSVNKTVFLNLKTRFYDFDSSDTRSLNKVTNWFSFSLVITTKHCLNSRLSHDFLN